MGRVNTLITWLLLAEIFSKGDAEKKETEPFFVYSFWALSKKQGRIKNGRINIAFVFMLLFFTSPQPSPKEREEISLLIQGYYYFIKKHLVK